ncbi:hypothetical protein, partial [Enterobacter hormaechei]|uniref:hypothetical protein n=1 Tax=Enterobacter hormaechei TaxID=158836 RepID=UPI003F683FA8
MSRATLTKMQEGAVVHQLDVQCIEPVYSNQQPPPTTRSVGVIANDALAEELKTYGREELPNNNKSKTIFGK